MLKNGLPDASLPKPMPREPQFCPAGYPVHVFQRGNNRLANFTCDKDLAAYAHWLAEGADRADVAIHNIQRAGAQAANLNPLGYLLCPHNFPPMRINEIVHGKRAVTADTALRLAHYFGTSDRFWMGLQADHNLEDARNKLGSRLNEGVISHVA